MGVAEEETRRTLNERRDVVITCTHDQLEVSNEWHDDMHCEGWWCQVCSSYIHGECHLQSWCREDFCGMGLPTWVSEDRPMNTVRG